MITILEQLGDIYRSSGKTIKTISEDTGLTPATVRGILMRDKSSAQENPNLQSIIDIAECFGCELVIVTPRDKKAQEDPQDITAYRSMLASKDRHIEQLISIIDRQQVALDKKDAKIEELTKK